MIGAPMIGVAGRRALAALALLVSAGACQGTGRDTDEAPGRKAGAPEQSASGEVAEQSNLPGMNASSAMDTVAKQGVAGSGTAATPNYSGSIGTPGSGVLHTGDPGDPAVRAGIALINRSEVEASQLALQKGQHADVKRYAQMMLDAHQGAAGPSPQTAAPEGSEASDLTVMLADQHRKSMQLLQRTPAGPAFDRAYVNGQVASHEGSLQMLTRFETAARDDALVQRLRQMKQEVERHRGEAQRVQAALRPTS